MPIPLLMLAIPAAVGAVTWAGATYYAGQRAGRPPSLAQLGRAALVGLATGGLIGGALAGPVLGAGAAGSAVIATTPGAAAGVVLARADDFIDDGRLNGSTSAPAPAPAPPPRPAPRPLFGSAAARDRLAAQLEESERARAAAGVPSADQVADAMGGIADMIGGGSAPGGASRPAPSPPVPTGDLSDLERATAVLNGISDQIEAQRRELDRTAPSPTRGMTAALQGGAGQ